MYNMYQLDAFVQSSPADQDIINHYKLQFGASLSGHGGGNKSLKKHEELETPTYTTSIPPNVTVSTNNNHQ